MPDSTRKLQITTTVRDLASKMLDRIGLRGKKAGTSIALSFIKAHIAMAAFRAAIRGIRSAIRGITSDVAEYADRIGKMSLRLNISTEALSELAHVADLAGIEFNQFAMALQRQGRRIQEAAEGTGEAVNALKELEGFGLATARELRSMSLDEQFMEIARALEAAAGSGRQLALAFKLFDAEGVKLLQLINASTDSIEKFREEARRLGISVSQHFANVAASFKDAQTRLRRAIDGIQMAIAVELLPWLTRAFEELAEWFASHRGQIRDFVLRGIRLIAKFATEALALVIRFMGNFVEKMAKAEELIDKGIFSWKLLVVVWEEALEQSKKLGQGAAAASEDVRTLGERWEDAFRNKVAGAMNDAERALGAFADRLPEIGVGGDRPGKATPWEQFALGIKEAAKASEQFFKILGSAVVDATATQIVGFMDAMIDRTKDLKQAFRDMVESIIRDLLRLAVNMGVRSAFNSIPGLPDPTAPGGPSLAGAGSGNNLTVQVNQTVNAAPGMDEAAVAELAADGVIKKLQTSYGYRSRMRGFVRGGLY